MTILWCYFERAKRHLLVDAGGIAPASRRGLTAGYYVMVGVYVGALGWTDSPGPPGRASSKPAIVLGTTPIPCPGACRWFPIGG